MIITGISKLSGKVTTRNIDVTLKQMKAWENGELIQNAMPDVSAVDREFIMTGTTKEEWNGMFGDDQ